MVENNLLNNIATWCSIAGFIISLVTLWYAKLIKTAVKKAETKALFNTMSSSVLEQLRKLNTELASLLQTNDEQKIKNVLNKLKTQLIILLRYIPNDFNNECFKTRDKVEYQYKSIIIFNKNTPRKKIFILFKKETNINDLWDTYNSINAIIDYITKYKHEKNIVS